MEPIYKNMLHEFESGAISDRPNETTRSESALSPVLFRFAGVFLPLEIGAFSERAVMSESELAEDFAGHKPSPKASLWLRELPYIVVLALTLVGVFLSTVARTPPIGYWEFMALVIGVVCVLTAWPTTQGRKARLRLVVSQALHWIAFLIAMNITLLPDVQRVLNSESAAITLLLLLALGAVTAGISIMSWQISFIGAAIALSILLKVWVQQSAVVILLGLVVALVGAGVVFSWHRGAERRDGGSPGEKQA